MINTTENRATTAKVMALGLLLAALMAASLLAASQARASTTFTVNSTEDHSDAILTVGACDTGYLVTRPGGEQEAECTLRAAMEQANHTPGADTINFAIPGSGVKTISPTSPLPNMTEALTINGYSQPGAQPNQKAVGSDAVLKVELSGANAPSSGAVGLRIGASNSTVKGLVVNRWSDTGIYISGSGTTGNKVTGNFVGTDASGTQKLGNYYGVWVYGAPNTTIGGTTPAERNVISANDGPGVLIQLAAAKGNGVVGNYIGTDRNGTAALGNGQTGVWVYDAPNTTIGGTRAGERNVISANGANGVWINGDSSTTGNRILSNSIFSNGGQGIDLGYVGPTANDPGDTDTGPNGLQNKPVLSSARNADGKTTVRGKLNSSPNRTFKVQFFSNPSGTDEGKVFIGQKSVTTDGSGNATFAFSPAQKVALGRTITATATSPGGSTSEFSAARTVISA